MLPGQCCWRVGTGVCLYLGVGRERNEVEEKLHVVMGLHVLHLGCCREYCGNNKQGGDEVSLVGF